MKPADDGTGSKWEAGPNLLDFEQEIFGALRGSVFPPGRRTQLSLAALFVAQDHFRAIAMLVEKEQFASALALSRVLFEAVVKGLWINRCAPEGQLEAYANGREVESLKTLSSDLLSTDLPEPVRQTLRRTKQESWKMLSSFTHAGHAQIKRWLSATGVEPGYAEAEIQEVVDFAAFMALAAALEMAVLSNNTSATAALERWLLPTRPASGCGSEG